MTREEEIVRSTMAALAGTVTRVRPLQLTKAADEVNGSVSGSDTLLSCCPGGAWLPPCDLAVARDRVRRAGGAWGAPVAAAAVVIALAVALVVVRHMPSGGRATPAVPGAGCVLPEVSRATPAGAAASVDGVPPYYVEVVACSGSTSRSGLLVGGTLTGTVVATVAPPSGVSFRSVSAAADDRTFAVFATPIGACPAAGLRWWYLLRLAPGTSSPARLTRIPVKPLPDVAETALSGSGWELAVGVANDEARRPWIWVLLGGYRPTAALLVLSQRAVGRHRGVERLFLHRNRRQPAELGADVGPGRPGDHVLDGGLGRGLRLAVT